MEIHVILRIQKIYFYYNQQSYILWGIHIELGGRKMEVGVRGMVMGAVTVFLRNGLLVLLVCNEIQGKTDKTRQNLSIPLIPVPKRGFPDPRYFSLLFSRTLTTIPCLASPMLAPNLSHDPLQQPVIFSLCLTLLL